jgi:hypothetical protein
MFIGVLSFYIKCVYLLVCVCVHRHNARTVRIILNVFNLLIAEMQRTVSPHGYMKHANFIQSKLLSNSQCRQSKSRSQATGACQFVPFAHFRVGLAQTGGGLPDVSM